MLVAGSRSEIEVFDRRRVALCDPAIEGSKQLFHRMEPMPFAQAQAFATRCTSSSDKLARSAIAALEKVADANKLRLTGVCITTASGRPLPDLRGILASHALIHAAEGEFYRDALARAAETAELKVSRIKEKEAAIWAASRLAMSEGVLREKLAVLGKKLGPPWSVDEKLATLAAWLVLAA